MRCTRFYVWAFLSSKKLASMRVINSVYAHYAEFHSSTVPREGAAAVFATFSPPKNQCGGCTDANEENPLFRRHACSTPHTVTSDLARSVTFRERVIRFFFREIRTTWNHVYNSFLADCAFSLMWVPGLHKGALRTPSLLIFRIASRACHSETCSKAAASL